MFKLITLGTLADIGNMMVSINKIIVKKVSATYKIAPNSRLDFPVFEKVQPFSKRVYILSYRPEYMRS